jgi:hypothetical protein
MSRYFKHQELIILDASQSRHSIRLNSLYPIDKMRISVYDDVNVVNFKPLVLVYSDLTNSIIGTAANVYGDNIGFLSQLKPQNGIEFYYTDKMIINGQYNVRLTDINGNDITGYTNDINLFIEYYA